MGLSACRLQIDLKMVAAYTVVGAGGPGTAGKAAVALDHVVLTGLTDLTSAAPWSENLRTGKHSSWPTWRSPAWRNASNCHGQKASSKLSRHPKWLCGTLHRPPASTKSGFWPATCLILTRCSATSFSRSCVCLSPSLDLVPFLVLWVSVTGAVGADVDAAGLSDLVRVHVALGFVEVPGWLLGWLPGWELGWEFGWPELLPWDGDRDGTSSSSSSEPEVSTAESGQWGLSASWEAATLVLICTTYKTRTTS